MLFKSAVISFAIGLGLVGHSAQTQAETAQEFYEGKTIRWIIPYRPGGGFDAYSRLIAPYFETCTGSSVNLVNMPGAGSLKGTLEVFRAPADGLHVGLLNGSGMISRDILEGDDSRAPISAFTVIGRIASEETVLLASFESGVTSHEQIINAETPVVFGATSGGSSYADALIPAEILGFNQRVVSGFDSSSQVGLALLRGDIQAHWASYSTQAKAIRDGHGLPLLRTGRGPLEFLDGVPSVLDLRPDLSPSDQVFLDAWVAIADSGRILMAPPNVPTDRRDFLVSALDCALSNPELQAKGVAAERVVTFLSGAETEALILNAVSADAETIARLRSAMTAQ